MDFIAYTISRDGVVKYVGITTKGLDKRWKQHCEIKRRGVLAKAIKKYGPAAFVVEHVASSWSAAGLNALEVILIAQHGTFGRGYNMTTGGGQGLSFSADVLAKMSEKAKETHSSPKTRNKMSESAKRRFASEEGKKAHSLSQVARWTPEARAAQAERARKQYEVPGAKEAQAERAKSWFSTPTARQENKQRAIARWEDPATRAMMLERKMAAYSNPAVIAKISAAQKRRQAAKRQQGDQCTP